VDEPQWDWEGHTQEGSRWSNADVKAVLRALCPQLKQRDLRTQIAIIESGNIPDMSGLNEAITRKYGTASGDYLDAFAGMREMLSGRIGYHSYWSDRLDGQLIQHRTALARKMQQYAGWKLWQTEYCVMEGPNGEGG
jgi:hypothetical protein